MADAIGPDERLELLRNKLCTIVANDLFRNSKSGEQITSMVELEVVELTEITSGHLLCASTTTNLSCKSKPAKNNAYRWSLAAVMAGTRFSGWKMAVRGLWSVMSVNRLP